MWRIPASYFSEHPEVALRDEFETDVHPIQFDETCHKSFCAELKMLYTIVTRAKRYIWIYEDSPHEKVPMFEYWYKRDLIEIVTELARLDEHQTSLLLASSSTEDWKKQGDIYMEKRLWQQAKKCYQKANEQLLQNIAHAHALEERALKSQDTSQYREAAAMFIHCCKLAPRKELAKRAAFCLYEAKMYTESIQLYEKVQEVGIIILLIHCTRMEYMHNKVEAIHYY